MRHSIFKSINRAAPALSVLVLAGVIAFGEIDPDSIPGVEDYQRDVRVAIESIPYRIGPWVGSDEEVAPAAIKLLKPNKLLQRHYVDPDTGRAFSLLVVHTGDTRDMLGHYPPVCYPAHGWKQNNAKMTTFRLDNAKYPAFNYSFSRLGEERRQDMDVFSFFVLPNGQIVATMEDLVKASGYRAGSQLGAAQIQILGGEAMTDDERREVIDQFVRAISKTIHVIAGGVRR